MALCPDLAATALQMHNNTHPHGSGYCVWRDVEAGSRPISGGWDGLVWSVARVGRPTR
ncbi:MAG: hypothetical protein JWR37_5569 [Mycobacterium sp.]|jgi:hypothetical protein|nr:hypothetical protein [Mycobacterium sp.]